MAEDRDTALLDMTVGIVANYVANNRLKPDALPALIASTHAALSHAGAPGSATDDSPAPGPTASQIRRSVSEAGIVSFIDGRTYQALKRHLGRHGHTPESYRAAFGLPADYPIVSPTYSSRRSVLAKASGLGQGGRKPKTAPKSAGHQSKAKRGR